MSTSSNGSKVALVTGATRGIGFETVRQLAQSGVHTLLAGRDRGRAVEAALEACRLRLRPIVMTSIAFIAGTVPLVLSHGAGAEVRQATGITVFSGMIGVTMFGLFLTPVFYVALRKLAGKPLVSHGTSTVATHAPAQASTHA